MRYVRPSGPCRKYPVAPFGRNAPFVTCTKSRLILCVHSWSKSFGTALAGLYVVPHGRYICRGFCRGPLCFPPRVHNHVSGHGDNDSSLPTSNRIKEHARRIFTAGRCCTGLCSLHPFGACSADNTKPPSPPQGEDCRRSPCQTPQTSISADVSVRFFFNICCQESSPLNAGLCRSSWFLPSFLPYLRDMVRHRGAGLDECLAQCRAPHRLDHATRP